MKLHSALSTAMIVVVGQYQLVDLLQLSGPSYHNICMLDRGNAADTLVDIDNFQLWGNNVINLAQHAIIRHLTTLIFVI